MRLGQRLHTLTLELYSDELRLQIKIWTIYWNYNFRNNASDWDYGFRLGLQLQIEIRATDWDLGNILRIGLHIGILNLEIQIGHWATYWNYKFRNKDDWDYSYRLRFGLQIGITATD